MRTASYPADIRSTVLIRYSRRDRLVGDSCWRVTSPLSQHEHRLGDFLRGPSLFAPLLDGLRVGEYLDERAVVQLE
jgi:hypothetical protein